MYDKNGLTPNYGVIWIEDPMRKYVKTLALWGVDYVATSLTMYSLNTRKGCDRDSADVTGAHHEADDIHLWELR